MPFDCLPDANPEWRIITRIQVTTKRKDREFEWSSHQFDIALSNFQGTIKWVLDGNNHATLDLIWDVSKEARASIAKRNWITPSQMDIEQIKIDFEGLGFTSDIFPDSFVKKLNVPDTVDA